ncbi:MAG: hypothetical protein AAFN74_25580, partial [Myxococcota bacterium]
DQRRFREASPVYEQAIELMSDNGRANRVDYPDLSALVADFTRLLKADGREADARALEQRFR